MMRWDTKKMSDQSQKTAIVTGANSGTGFEAAKALALKDANVIMACRNEKSANNSIELIRKEYPKAKIQFYHLDLSHLDSVKSFAQSIKSNHSHVDLLINNAGVLNPQEVLSKDGFEMHFAVNFLGHFALTLQLMPLLLNAKKSRIVSMGSAVERYAKIDSNSIRNPQSYSRGDMYNQSKLANFLFTYGLARRLESENIDMIAAIAHPGWTASNLQGNSPTLKILNPIFSQTPLMGALPLLFAATHESVANGDYYGPDGFLQLKGYPRKITSSRASHDQHAIQHIWDISESFTGIQWEKAYKIELP